MKRSIFHCSVLAVAVLVVPVAAQDSKAPRTPWGTPDFNGVWSRPYVPDVEAAVGHPLSYTNWGREKWESYDPEHDGDYSGACLPVGHMRSMNGPDPIQFLQTPDNFAFLYEQNTWFKVLPIEGESKLPKVPSWYGESRANWDGDTLVITTTNFNGKTRLDTRGHPHSDQLTLTERFTRTDADHIQYQVTVDDPKTYTEPFTESREFTLRPDWDLIEYSCNENNKGLVEGRIKVPNFDDEP